MGVGDVSIVRASERFVTRRPGIVSSHEFSFGEHYDPARTSYGPLVAHNVETVDPGHGFDVHRHHGVEILTWVVRGRLRHEGGAGDTTVLTPGGVQRLDAVEGADHTETNAETAATADPVTFVQMWLRVDDDPPETGGLPPAYQHAELADSDLSSGLKTIASSQPAPASTLRLRSPGLRFAAALIAPDESVTVPTGSRGHLYVVRGRLILAGSALAAGDSAHLTDVDTDGVPLTSSGLSLVLVLSWE